MQQDSTGDGSIFDTPADRAAKQTSEEPQQRERQASGILGEPPGSPPGTEVANDDPQSADPIQEQVPQDGKDHWRR